jgi:hypothetical protein
VGKINIKYVAQVMIEDSVDENEPDVLSYEEIKKNVEEELTKNLTKLVNEEVAASEKCQITVVQLVGSVSREDVDSD